MAGIQKVWVPLAYDYTLWKISYDLVFFAHFLLVVGDNLRFGALLNQVRKNICHDKMALEIHDKATFKL